MNDNNTAESINVQIGNQIINLANNALQEGHSPHEIATGLRQAAANFSAFAFVRLDDGNKDPNMVVEQFVSLYQYYLNAHAPQQAGDNLKDLIKKAEEELD